MYNRNAHEPKDSENPQKNNNYDWEKIIPFILLGGFLVWLFYWVSNLFKRIPHKIQKEDLLTSYGVNKKTLAKWVQYFCDPKILSLETYHKKRRLTLEESLHLISCLGIKSDEMDVRGKVGIADIVDSDTDTLRRWVIENGHSIGLSIDAYNALNVFPPLIAYNLLNAYDSSFAYSKKG